MMSSKARQMHLTECAVFVLLLTTTRIEPTIHRSEKHGSIMQLEKLWQMAIDVEGSRHHGYLLPFVLGRH